MKLIRLSLILSLTLTVKSIANTVEYFALGCSSSDKRNSIEGSHTAFRYAKMLVNEKKERAITDKVDISWLPANYAQTGRLPLLAVEGHNFTIEESAQMAKNFGLAFSCFRPYLIDKKLFEAAQNRAATLKKGIIKYKLFAVAPIRHRRAMKEVGGTLNCINANSDLAGAIKIEPLHGPDATKATLDHFAKAGLLFGGPQSKELSEHILAP